MGRKRKNNKDLPERVYKKHGSYYFVTPENKWINLGKTKPEMYKALADLEIRPSGGYTITNLWEDFRQDHMPSLSPATIRGYETKIKPLLEVFGRMAPDEIKSSDIARYLMIRGRKAKTCANGETAMFSSMFTFAVGLGICEANPCLRVKRHKVGPRDRYVEDWELAEFRKVCDEFMDCYVELKYLTGLRQTDMLSLTKASIRESGLYVRPSKTANSTGETREFIWTTDLLDVIHRIERLPKPVHAKHLFVRKNGKPFIDEELIISGFGSKWSETMTLAITETKLEQRFQEKDIRAKTATDADDDGQNATAILGHEDSRTTRIYIRSKQIKRVSPLQRKKDGESLEKPGLRYQGNDAGELD